MNLCGEFIEHKVFGRGQIVDVEDNCVTVVFEESNEKKRFLYPAAFGTFLTLDNKQKVKQVQDYKDELAQNIASARMEIEDHRQLLKKEQSKKAKKPVKKAVKKPEKTLV